MAVILCASLTPRYVDLVIIIWVTNGNLMGVNADYGTWIYLNFVPSILFGFSLRVD